MTGPPPPPDALRVARAAGEFLRSAVAVLSTVSDDDLAGEAVQTALAETSLLVFAIDRSPEPEAAALVQGLRALLRAAYGRAAARSLAFEGPPEAFVGQLFLRLGIREEAERWLPSPALARLMRTRNILQLPRSAVRTLEMAFVLDALRLPHPLPRRAELAELALRGVPDISERLVEDVYLLTHVVFYATDFGLASGQPLEEAASARAARKLASVRAPLSDMEHWDLLLEVLFARRCLHACGDHRDDACWAIVAAAQRADGRLGDGGAPPPGGRWSVSEALAGYHKCLVAVLAAYG